MTSDYLTWLLAQRDDLCVKAFECADETAALLYTLIQLAAEQDARITALEQARSRDDGDGR